VRRSKGKVRHPAGVHITVRKSREKSGQLCRCSHHCEEEQREERAALQVSRKRAIRMMVPPRSRNPHSTKVLLDSSEEKMTL
jgi:hypothetical protein